MSCYLVLEPAEFGTYWQIALPHRNGGHMEDGLTVFVSSVIADTPHERREAQRVLPTLAVAKPWIFEFTPASEEPLDRAYLSKVEECDLFVLILGKRITDPVLREWGCAQWPHPKPTLIFVRDERDRETPLETFVQSVAVKYKLYESVEQFSEYLVEAVCDWLIRSVTSDKMALQRQRTHFWKARMLHWKGRCEFDRLGEAEPRSPRELTKDMALPERIIPLMAKLPQITSVPEQIQFAREQHYAEQYTDSVVEHEAELIGHEVLTRLTRLAGPFSSMYDAGSANCAQYRSLMCVEGATAPDFHYYAQDFNPDWRASFSVPKGEFIEKVLPGIADERCDLVACTHTLHYMEANPLAIYSSFLSFNKLLRDGGFCYVTVPTKDSQPGMIDVIEQSALDGGFSTIAYQRTRMRHNLSNVAPWNVTTFVSFIFKKTQMVDLNTWSSFRAVSQFRAGMSSTEVKTENDIPGAIRLIEANLRETIIEDDPLIRLFRRTLRRIAPTFVTSDHRASPAECAKRIGYSINALHDVLIGGESKRRELANACATYFLCLAQWFLAEGYGRQIYELISRLQPIVASAVRSRRNIRVVLDDLTPEGAARLMRNLFEICSYHTIDLKAAVEEEMPRLVSREFRANA